MIFKCARTMTAKSCDLEGKKHSIRSWFRKLVITESRPSPQPWFEQNCTNWFSPLSTHRRCTETIRDIFLMLFYRSSLLFGNFIEFVGLVALPVQCAMCMLKSIYCNNILYLLIRAHIYSVCLDLSCVNELHRKTMGYQFDRWGSTFGRLFSIIMDCNVLFVACRAHVTQFRYK